MFFTKSAKTVAWLIFLAGAAKVVMALSIAFIDDLEARKVAVEQYLGTGESSTGASIDRGSLYILVALILGTLAEISLAVQKYTRPKDQGNERASEKQ